MVHRPTGFASPEAQGSRVRLTLLALRSRRPVCVPARSAGCKSPRLRTVQAGRFDRSFDRNEGDTLCRTPRSRAACGVLVIVHADLTAFRLDRETARRGATRAKARERTAGRLGIASPAQVSESEINGGLHRKS